MLLEQWTKWESLGAVPNIYFLQKFSDCRDKFELLFTATSNSNTQRQFKLLFEPPIIFYRICDESARIKTLGEIDYNGKEKFLQVTNSHLLHGLSKQYHGFKQLETARHFAFMEPNLVVDIIITNEPQIIWL